MFPCRLSENSLKLLHNIVLENDPNAGRGYIYKSMIKGSMDRAFTKVFSYDPYTGIFNRAAALAHSIIVFHPFIDGNKRTAILTVYFFLLFHGYRFAFPKDTANFVLKISKGEINDIVIIAKWIQSNSERVIIIMWGVLLITRIILSLRKIEIDLSPSQSLTSACIKVLNITKRIWPK